MLDELHNIKYKNISFIEYNRRIKIDRLLFYDKYKRFLQQVVRRIRFIIIVDFILDIPLRVFFLKHSRVRIYIIAEEYLFFFSP